MSARPGSGSLSAAAASTATPVDKPRPGWAQHDPEQLWTSFLTALRQAAPGLAAAADVRQIQGLASASVGEAAVPLDRHGEPTFAALAWPDERTRAQAA